jgi:hypothetical protein
MDFVNLLIVLMISLLLLTFVPVQIVGNSSRRKFLGFHYDKEKEVVVPPLWLPVLYLIFFIFFSSAYLYFWIKEAAGGNYKQDETIFSALLFLGIIHFVVIPLIHNIRKRWKEDK